MGRALAETGMTTPGCLEHASWKFRHRKVIPKQRPSHPNPQNPGSAELDPLPDPPTTISHRPMALNAGINNSLAPRPYLAATDGKCTYIDERSTRFPRPHLTPAATLGAASRSQLPAIVTPASLQAPWTRDGVATPQDEEKTKPQSGDAI
ncbi:hypothetical protein BD779DRAFT_1674876 [Infundibulicybe gibba]|nr:hypothetical protein BD779DRAFT_1680734 [Infundibulicybe gibba]KAF8878241.1 hypothetical protein BD779DRAFT_1676981 [Infundibulicybe gibba]KAF8882733.1 hypothetical protein BD779DRAFT_1674876 [Infundibulicybe gibba]